MQYSRALPRAVLAGLIAGFLASFSPAIAAVYPPERALPAQTIQQCIDSALMNNAAVKASAAGPVAFSGAQRLPVRWAEMPAETRA